MFLFGLFIIACGLTHLLDVVNIWSPNYWANAYFRVITALASIFTAISLWKIMPIAINAPSVQQLNKLNQQLEMSRLDLEHRVGIRTQELSEALAEAHRFSNALDHISAYVYLKDKFSNYVYANRPTLELLKCSLEELRGSDDFKFFPTETAARLRSIDSRIIEHGEESAEEIEIIFEDGVKRIYWEIKAPIYEDLNNTQIWGVCGISTEITERKAAADRIQHLAYYDLLTQLPNRQLLISRLRLVLASSERNVEYGSLLFLDLDHFKTLNDTLGHDIGDLLLQQVSLRIVHCVREIDTVARLGGDEFIVMLDSISGSELEAATHAEIVGEKILASLNQPFKLNEIEYQITTSIGITIIGGNKQSVDELLKHADIAMYQAKKVGRNTLRFFDPEMQEAINTRAKMEQELHQAIDKNEFELYYQVQVDNTGLQVGAEALIRWNHPLRGLVLPFDFIPLAEETGLIIPIGRWVVESACQQLKSWQFDPNTRDLTLSINVSAKQFKQIDFAEQVRTLVSRYEINPALLKLELTESILFDETERVITIMLALQATGVRFVLDDFGTGYSSLQYLKRLPLYQLKIDQSFVRDIASDLSDQAIVQTIIAMAKSLNLDVIAEGVETKQQKQRLVKKGCRLFQGYLFGRPMPLSLFQKALK